MFEEQPPILNTDDTTEVCAIDYLLDTPNHANVAQLP